MRAPAGIAAIRLGTRATDRAAFDAARPAPEPIREPTESAATAPMKLNNPKTANGANATSTRPIRSGHDCGSQIVRTFASPLMMSVTKPIVSGPVSSSTATADT